MGINVSQLYDEQNLKQNALFSACVVKDKNNSLRIVQYFLAQGIPATQQDTLNQIPMFYAAREGHIEVVKLLLSKGCNPNHVDTYGQTPIFYCIREGNIECTDLMVNAGANCDWVDDNGQSPMYYAIKQGHYEMVEYLIHKGANLKNVDKKGITLSQWAKRQNKQQILDLLLQHGANPISENKKAKVTKKVVEESKEKINERKISKRYLLTRKRENGNYEPLTDEEFEQFCFENPSLAPFFQDELAEKAIAELPIPEVPIHAPIYDQWEKAAQRLLTQLSRNQSAYIFAEPVNVEALNIPDYYTVVKEPMDFGTVKSKLKDHVYNNISEFLRDMELVFYNCKLYNGETSTVGLMGKNVHEDFKKLKEQLFLSFYE